MERLLRLFPVLLLAVLAAMTYWLDQAMQSLPAKPADKRLLHHPDFTVEKLLATRMDVNGRIRDTLQAVKMVHYPDDDSTELEQPRFVSLARGAPLTITSQKARVSSNAGNVYFHGDVRADRAAQAGKSAMTLTTDYLHYLPDDNIVKTDRRVTISDANMRLEAVGMELNGETRVLKLYAGVRGVYHDAQTIANANRARNKR
jgi:lipopolysaccharide export system protein LptC